MIARAVIAFIFPNNIPPHDTVLILKQQYFPAMGNTSSSPVVKCLEGAVGKDLVHFKNDPLFQLSYVKPYNLGVGSTPAAVVYPKTTDHVSKIVKCAVDNGLKVQPRCGGHSYANYGMFAMFHTPKQALTSSSYWWR